MSTSTSEKRPTKKPESLFDRVPPQDLEAERSVLGSCLLQAEVIDDVLTLIRGEMFYFEAHQKIWRRILAMYESGIRAIDTTTLAHELQKHGELEDVGGPPYLVQILETVPHAAHAEFYARIVREKWQRRSVIAVCTSTIKQSFDSPDDTEDVLARAESQIHRLTEGESASRLRSAADCASDFITVLDADTPPGVPTGLSRFDELVGGGLQPGAMTVLAARTSVGKTALAGNTALSIAQRGNAVLFCTLEQSYLELTERFVSVLSGVPAVRIHRQEFSADEHSRVLDAAEQFRRLPIQIEDSTQQTVQRIAAAARLAKRRQDLRLVVVDYLQLVEPEDKRAIREQQVAAASRGLKAIAKDLEIPVLVLAQLNRGVENRENKTPRLADLRESGAIEQDADVVAFIDRPATYETAPDHEATLIVAKNRAGSRGTVQLHWDRLTMHFTEPACTTEDFR